MCINVITVITKELLILLHCPRGEDPNNLSPPRVLHLSISAIPFKVSDISFCRSAAPAVWSEAVVDFVAQTCSVEACVSPHLQRKVDVVGVVAVDLDLVDILHHLGLLKRLTELYSP